jgi:hypothetical protein
LFNLVRFFLKSPKIRPSIARMRAEESVKN